MDFNQQNVSPAVLLNVISVLENGDEPVSWTLSRTWKGQFSLTVKSPAIVKGKVDISTQRPQDAEKAAPEWNISKQKGKKPSRARRIGSAGLSGTRRRKLEPVLPPRLWNNAFFGG